MQQRNAAADRRGVKGRFTGVPAPRGALQTPIIGGFAAAAALAIARLIS